MPDPTDDRGLYNDRSIESVVGKAGTAPIAVPSLEAFDRGSLV